jgi:hypothetical protein
VGFTVGVAGVRRDPYDAIADLDCSRGDVVGPKIKGAATGEIKTGVMPMAGQDAVFD